MSDKQKPIVLMAGDSEQAHATVAALIAENESLRKDAELCKVLKGAMFGVLEGHNIPHVTRKVLEQAYYSGVDVFADDAAIDQARGAE